MTTGLRVVAALAMLALTACQPSYIPAPVVELDPAPSAETAAEQAPPEPSTPPTAALSPSPSAAPAIPEGPRPEFYTVKSGDTLVAIGLGFGLSHRDIALWNGIANPDRVQAGRVLRLSPPAAHPVAKPVAAPTGGADENSLATGADNDGVTTTGIQAVRAPGLLELAPDGSAAAAGAAAAAAGVGGLAAPDASGTNSPSSDEGVVLRPETTFAGGAPGTGGVEAGAGGVGGVGGVGVGGGGVGVGVKTGPLAEGFAYSAAKLRELRTAWEAQGGRIDGRAPSVAPGANANADGAAEVARAAPGAELAARAAGPEAVRRAHGIEWSWPARGNLLTGFTESSRGWDIAGESGDLIFAAADGKVIYAGSGIKGFGRLVIVKHDNDYLSAYAHNRKILKAEGARVRRGEAIAEMGDSGAARTKLHFEIRKAGKPTDPAGFLPERP